MKNKIKAVIERVAVYIFAKGVTVLVRVSSFLRNYRKTKQH